MKKLTLILLSVLLVASLFVSCKVEGNDPGSRETATLRFRTDDETRALSSSRTTLDTSNYDWYYTAEKSDAYYNDENENSNDGVTGEQTKVYPTPATGTKSEKTPVGTTKQLDETVGPFSLGKWNFTLYAYVKGSDISTPDEPEKNLVYIGSVDGFEITEKTTTIDITVQPQTGYGTGTLKVEKGIKFTSNGTEYKATTVTVENLEKGAPADSIKENGTESNYWQYNCKSGSYKVTVSYKTENNNVTSASNTIYVNVWSNLTTTISGTLDEITVEANFVARENEDESIMETAEIENNSEAVYLFNYSPASNEYSGSSNELGTTVKGTFKGGTETAYNPTLVVTTYPATSSNINSNLLFGVAEGDDGHPVAGIDIKLMNASFATETVDGSSVNKTAIVSTYIIKGLTSPKMYHDGTEEKKVMESESEKSESAVDADGEWWYDSTSGKLVFATDSIGSFWVTSTDVTINSTTNTACATLQEAIDSAKTGEVITLICDSAGNGLETADGTGEKRTLTIDFNGYTYTISGDPVGSSGTETQAMHWGEGTLEKVNLKNGKFTVASEISNLQMGMQNYVAFTAENMVFDFSNITPVTYDAVAYKDYPKYIGKQKPIFNNNAHNNSTSGTITLINTTVIMPENDTAGLNQDGGEVVIKSGSKIEGYVSINSDTSTDATVKISNDSVITKGVIAYFEKEYKVAMSSKDSERLTTYSLEKLETDASL